MVVLLSYKNPDNYINVKVEFGNDATKGDCGKSRKRELPIR